jgi:hypothetical protein
MDADVFKLAFFVSVLSENRPEINSKGEYVVKY